MSYVNYILKVTVLLAEYSLTSRLAVDALFSYVSQDRNVTYQAVVPGI